MTNQTTRRTTKSPLPVVRWLQVGAVAAGMGLALAAAPAAAADGGGSSSASESTPELSERGSSADKTADRASTAAQRGSEVSRAAARTQVSIPAVGRAAATVRQLPSVMASVPNKGPAATAIPTASVTPIAVADSSATASPAVPDVVGPPVTALRSASASPWAQASVALEQADPFGDLAAFLGLPWAPASTNPTLASVGLLARLTLDDLLGGSVAPPVTDSSAVITGLFRQTLRRDPTAAELQTYQGVWSLTGVNGVVAGLYNSTAFRQGQVNSYYQEIFDRNATAAELGWGTTSLLYFSTEPQLAAAIAGSRETYDYSGSGGGPYGTPPSASTFVSLLYRNLLGDIRQLDGVGQSYVTRIQAGLPIGLAAMEFVTDPTFRTAKVKEIYNVLGVTPSAAVVQNYVDNWFRSGGYNGIATTLLAGADNISRIATTSVSLPDATALAQYTEILLAPYNESDTGFVKLFERYLNTDPVTGGPCATVKSCNKPLLNLIDSDGTLRGMPNNILSNSAVIWANTRDIIPNQNEVDLDKSVQFPLNVDKHGIAPLQNVLAGGQVVAGSPILTANNGTYVLDGHHRWSQTFVFNPNTQIEALDIGYVPNPKEGLALTRVSVAVQDQFINSKGVDGINLYTVDKEVFYAKVQEYIDRNVNEVTLAFGPEGNQQFIYATTKQQLLATFGTFFDNVGNSYEAQLALYEPAKQAQINSDVLPYMWGNVLLMRQYNQFAPGATSRPFMPQPDGPYVRYLAPLQSGYVTFTFPIVSYLG